MVEVKSLLIATNNLGKVKEISKYLNLSNTKIYSYSEWLAISKLTDAIPDPEENGQTYYENSLIKAKAAYAWAKIPVLADDSGIEVKFLNGAPGIHSARFAGIGASDEDNLQKLLVELRNTNILEARYVSHLVYFDGNQVQDFRGELSGNIVRDKSGLGGFGYDPIFIPEGYSETAASLKEKGIELVTHRMKALSQFKAYVN